jgi:DNA repair ATPase RecN
MMNKRIYILLLTAMIGFQNRSQAQSYELARLILDIEKLSQLKSILSDLYKGYEILKTGYSTIKDISEGNFNLHKAFLDGLLAVSPAVQKYERIVEVIDLQAQIVKEYKTALRRYRQDKHFNPDELEYIGNVYSNLVDKSAKNLEDLLSVLTAGNLRMNDAERLKEIDGIYLDTRDQYIFLRKFNNSTDLLAVNRGIQDNDIMTLRNLYGIK